MDDIMDKLSWDRPEEEQREAIRLILADENFDIGRLAKLDGYKNKMRNCAIILSAISDEKLDPHVDDLLIWLQDMNWPGAVGIFNRLAIMPPSILKNHLNDAIMLAAKTRDRSWLMALLDLENVMKGAVNPLKNYEW